MEPISLRDCPMCHTTPGDEGVILTSENFIDLTDGAEVYGIGYTVRCCECGASVSHEYMSDAVRLWNGQPESDEAAQ